MHPVEGADAVLHAPLDRVVVSVNAGLVARLEDGEFFWREDQKLVISDLVEKLNNVTFHEKIGSLREHMIRTGQIGDQY